MIEPTVGRVVLYTPALGEGFYAGSQTQFAALIAAVNVDSTINLSVFDASGNSHARQNVPLVDEPQDGAHARWMEYQKGQAAKYEALAATIEPPMEQIAESKEQAPDENHEGSTQD